jgi:hypothetical protein
VPQEITLGTNLSMIGTTLNATGGAGAPGGSNTQVQYNNSGAFGGIANATTDGTTMTLTSPKVVTNIKDTNANTLLGITATASAVDYIGVKNSVTGVNPAVFVDGTDANISVRLEPKGSAGVDIGGNTTGYVPLSVINSSTGGKIWQIVNTGTSGLTSFFAPNSFLFYDNTDNKLPLDLSTTQVGTFSGALFGWWSDANNAGQGSFDTALARNAAGIVEIDNGTIGQYRDLLARNVNVTNRFSNNGISLANVVSNTGSSSNQTGFNVDQYLQGSNVTYAANQWATTGFYHCQFDMAKTAAGTAGPVITVRAGTAGTIADAAALTFTFAAGTAVADTAIIDVYLNIRNIGASGNVTGSCKIAHSLAATGLTSTGASGNGILTATGTGTFNSTTANQMGVSFNGGTSFSGTSVLTQSEYKQ